MTVKKEIVLRVRDIHKAFNGKEVLRGVSFDVFKGETKVVIGPSGTGKSTLLRCINQLTIPDQGTVWLRDQEVTHHNLKGINQFRQKIGMVFQDFNLFDHLNAVGNVEIALIKVKKMNRAKAREKAVLELKKVGLGKQALLYPAQLSGGQQQRVSIARALAMDPEVMLFDEPTSALDPELIGEVLGVMQKLAKEGMTMIVVTHEMGFARSVADDIIFLEKGKLLESGSPDKLFYQPKYERTRKFLFKLTELYGDINKEKI
ncbi:MAG: amino acid ABC transporter ATP-binding protein [Atribacterota bacterium]|nr:amino acid ABC transporter ATP-binding protein [Atribacterota bacterium]